MSIKDGGQRAWEMRLGTLGFRETALAFLRDRLRQEARKERVEQLIRRLSKYEPQVKIVKLLCQNPVWGKRIEADLPEVTADPEIHFIFQSDGNVPNIPTLGKNRLYFGSDEHFYALDADTGEIIWHRRSPGRTWSLAGLSQDCLYACAEGRLYALSPDDGHERWCFEVKKKLTSPYAYQGRVFVGSEEGTLYAVDAERGTRLWTFNVVSPVFIAPGGWENKIYAASKDHSLYAVRIEDGECLWHFTPGGKIYASPYVGDGIIYLPSADHKVYALGATRGRLLWTFTTDGEVRTSPLEKDGRVYLSSRDRYLYALDAEDGRELWRRQMLGYPSSPTAVGGMVYFSAQGRVYGFSTAPGKMHWCFPVGFSFATSPVIGNRRIYVGTLEGKLICLKFRTQLEEQGATQALQQFMNTETATASE